MIKISKGTYNFFSEILTLEVTTNESLEDIDPEPESSEDLEVTDEEVQTDVIPFGSFIPVYEH